jgi:hypothetical protein
MDSPIAEVKISVSRAKIGNFKKNSILKMPLNGWFYWTWSRMCFPDVYVVILPNLIESD